MMYGNTRPDIETDAIYHVIELFDRHIRYEIFGPEMVVQAIDMTNEDAYKRGIDCYIDHIHLDMSGEAQVVVRKFSDRNAMEMLSISQCFPAGNQNDFNTTIDINRMQDRFTVSFSNTPQIFIDEDIYPVIPPPENGADIVIQDIKDYIVDNFTAFDIRDNGSYMYDIIDQKILDECTKYSVEVFKNAFVVDYNAVSYRDELLKLVTLNDFYGLLDDIMRASMTQIEKISEVSKQYFI